MGIELLCSLESTRSRTQHLHDFLRRPHSDRDDDLDGLMKNLWAKTGSRGNVCGIGAFSGGEQCMQDHLMSRHPRGEAMRESVVVRGARLGERLAMGCSSSPIRLLNRDRPHIVWYSICEIR